MNAQLQQAIILPLAFSGAPGMASRHATTAFSKFLSPSTSTCLFNLRANISYQQTTRAMSPFVAATALENYTTLESLEYKNTFTTELPGDSSEENKTRQVQNALFSYVNPTPTGTEAHTIAYSRDVAQLIGLDPTECERPEFPIIFSGNAPLPGARPWAQCYGGHQFGMWAGQLGDGRAISLGEISTPDGSSSWELQLKGAGMTPYSRRADGRAVLRSSIREYIASEAMYALGVPTTRALSLVGTGDKVVRDMFYNGNAQYEPGAVVCRVARSFVRFGTFQLPVSRGDDQLHLTEKLADYVIKHFYPEVASNNKNKYLALLTEVATRTGRLVSEWHRVGFVHGVLNTDNMSILGDTIDYGPYGWLERFNPDFTPNTTDLPGRRYSFKAQPEIGQFNIVQLALSFVGANLVTKEEASSAVEAYADTFNNTYEAMMAGKLGLKVYDKELAIAFMQLLYEDSADYTNVFRALSAVNKDDTSGIPSEITAALGGFESKEREAAWEAWLGQYRALLRAEGRDNAERAQQQNLVNPAIIPRNHVMVGIIGEAEDGNYGPLHDYLDVLATPYQVPQNSAWLVPGPKQSRMGVELLSCSS